MSLKKLTLGACMAVALASAPIGSAAEKGQLSFDLGAARDPHGAELGGRNVEFFPRLSYQLSDRIALEPHLTLVHSSLNGWGYTLGTDVVRRFRPGKAWSPYLSAGLSYSHRVPVTPSAPGAPALSSNYLTFSSSVGIERTISRHFGLFAELQAVHDTGGQLGFDGTQWRPDHGLELTPVVGFRLKAF